MINRVANIRCRSPCITRNRSKCVTVGSVAFQTMCGRAKQSIETVIGTSGQFNGKDVLCNLEAYKAKMLMRDNPVVRSLSGFSRVVVLSVHTKILEMQVESRECEEFERRLQEEYGFNDSRKLTKKGLMDWCTTKVPQEFEKRCVLLSTLDRMALYMSKVLLFLRV